MKGNHISEQARILAISLSSRGFGYAILEGKDRLVGYGNKVISKNKNARSVAQIKKMIVRNLPAVLVLQDVKAKVKGTRRVPRIIRLQEGILELGKRCKIKTVTISGTELRRQLLGDEEGTKHRMAECLAAMFPDELASRLPPKRRASTNEDSRMDIFGAVMLAVVHDRIGLNETRAR